MRAMVLERVGAPLRAADVADPEGGPDDLVLRVLACGVCRTDLHVVDGDLAERELPRIPGHQIVGEVLAVGSNIGREGSGSADRRFVVGDRVGVPWLGRTCGACAFCREGRENLCDTPEFTGYDRDGGFAERCVADARFCFPLPREAEPLGIAPLLCAGLIGYRALRMTDGARRLGFYGFGSAAHILTQVARHQDREVLAFTRPGDRQGQEFARLFGCSRACGSDEIPDPPLDAAILFAPVGELVPAALRAVKKGGIVVCAGIHMSDIPAFPYSILWGERVVRSVANLTRADGDEFLALAPRVPVRTHGNEYALEDANRALDDLRHGRFTGSAVVVP